MQPSRTDASSRIPKKVHLLNQIETCMKWRLNVFQNKGDPLRDAGSWNTQDECLLERQITAQGRFRDLQHRNQSLAHTDPRSYTKCTWHNNPVGIPEYNRASLHNEHIRHTLTYKDRKQRSLRLLHPQCIHLFHPEHTSKRRKPCPHLNAYPGEPLSR